MNISRFQFSNQFYDSDSHYKGQQSANATKLNARFRISEQVYNFRKNLTFNIIFPSNNYYKYSPLDVFLFVEEQVQTQPQNLPILITLAVMGGIFLLSFIYLLICACLVYKISSQDPKISENLDAFSKAFVKLQGLTVFLEVLLMGGYILSDLWEKITKRSLHTIYSMIIMGIVCGLCSLAIYLGLFIPMAVNIETISKQESEILPISSQLGNSTYYACCKYRSSIFLKTFTTRMDTQDQNLSCVKPGFTTSIKNLNMNGNLTSSSQKSFPFVIGGSNAINSVILQCPNSEILFVSTNFDSIVPMAIVSLVCGTILLFTSVLYFTVAISNFIIKKIVNDKILIMLLFSSNWSRQHHHSNLATNSTATATHHSDTETEDHENGRNHDIELPTSHSDETQRIEQELQMANRQDQLRREELERQRDEQLVREEIDRMENEERLRRILEAQNKLEEANNPLDVKLPPPKPTQPVQVELPEVTVSEETANGQPVENPNDENPNSDILVFDSYSNQNQTVDNSNNSNNIVYNSNTGNEDMVVFYQRSDQNQQ